MAIDNQDITEELVYLIALRAVPGVGPVLCRNLVAYCGTARSVFQKNTFQLEKIPGIGINTAQAIKTNQKLISHAEQELSYYQKNNIRVIPYFDSQFPNNLKEIPDSPVVLYVRGHLELNQQIFVSIVGTRTPSEYGRQQAARFASYLAEANINIVSGLAFGVDAEAHKATLESNGLTTAIVAHGLDRMYPHQHKNLAEKIVNNGGAIITEYPIDTRPEPMLFPARNRIIAGLSMAVVVIEAAKKGGALITAQLSFDYNREVYAVPGNLGVKTSEGCNELIQKNIAKIIIHPEDLISELIPTITPRKQKSRVPTTFTEEQHAVLNILGDQTLSIDRLHELTQIPIGNLISILLELEFSEAIKQLPGRLFLRI